MSKKLTAPKVINQDFSYVSAKDGKTYLMTPKEKSFCDAYLELSGNGVYAIYEAGYKPKNAMVASVMAHENLRKPNIIAYINSKFEEAGLNDDDVLKQHLFLLNQHANLPAKAKAIDMYYKVKGRYAPDKKENKPLTMMDLLKHLDEKYSTSDS